MFETRPRWVGRIAFVAMLVSLSVVANFGCSKSDPAPPVKPEQTSPPADEAVRKVLDGLNRRDTRALWDFLPPSYQRDAQQLLRGVAERLDEPSWEPFVATWKKGTTVFLKLNSQRRIEPSKSAAGADDWDHSLSLGKLFEAIRDSELSDLRKLRALDVRDFLGSTGNKVFAAMNDGALKDSGLGGKSVALFGDVKVELVSSAQDSSVVSIQWPGQEPTTHTFVRVEDHWIPQTLAEAWPQQFPAVREQCLAWATELREHPAEWHSRLREIDRLLDELSDTKSSSETKQVWQAGVTRLAVAWFGITSPPEAPQAEPTPSNAPPPKTARVKRPDTEVLLPDEK